MKSRQWSAAWLAATAALCSVDVSAAQAAPAAGQQTPAEVGFHAPVEQRARQLAASGQPLNLLVASQLARALELSKQEPEATAPRQSDIWLDEAIRIGSDQPIIARAAVSRCIERGACDIAAAVDTLRTHEVDDLVAQLLLWRMAVTKEDDAATALAWTRVTHATRYVDEYAQALALLDRSTRGMQIPLPESDLNGGSDQGRLTMLFSWAAAFSMPVFSDVYRQCGKAVRVEHRQGCGQLLAVMGNSTSAVVVGLGSTMMQSYVVDAIERRRWQDRRQELAWVSEKTAALMTPGADGKSAADMNEYLRWIGEAGELGALQKLLVANSIALQPPAGWQPTKLY